MVILLIILFAFGSILFLITYFNRKNKPDKTQVIHAVNDECCGAHIICERESLLNSGKDIIYYDDEELDYLSNINPENYTNEQINSLSEVFYTLKENDVAGWLRSLQMRNIELPQDLKDAAFLIIQERRKITV